MTHSLWLMDQTFCNGWFALITGMLQTDCFKPAVLLQVLIVKQDNARKAQAALHRAQRHLQQLTQTA